MSLGVRQHHARHFPGLLGGPRTTFARQAANFWRAKQLLQQRLAHRLALQRGYFGTLEQLAPGQELKANVKLRSPSSIG